MPKKYGPVFLLLLSLICSINLQAQIVTEDSQEQAAIEALLKNAELDWEDIYFLDKVITSGSKDGHTLVHLLGDKSDIWRINQIDDRTIYLNEKGKVIAMELNKTKLKDLTLINNFKSLIHFSCRCRKIKDFKRIENLPHLESLDLHRSSLTKIGTLKNLPHLKFLDLGRNPISKLENLENLKNLKKLILRFQRIEKLE